MRELCGDLAGHVRGILAEWRALPAEEPWLVLPAAEEIDHLPGVIVGLLNASLCEPERGATYREKVWAAARHGGDRRRQGFGEPVLFTEYARLREAIWRYLRRLGPADAARAAIVRVDGAITCATRASLLGYHRPELEQLGLWPEKLEALAREGPLLGRGDSAEAGG